jgi:hypothetical protein
VIHEAWVEKVEEACILARATTGPADNVTNNGQQTRKLDEPETFIVVKGQGFI